MTLKKRSNLNVKCFNEKCTGYKLFDVINRHESLILAQNERWRQA